jgi:hypothetical protein
MDFLESKFFQDLKNGKLPAVEVALTTESLIQLAATTAITAIVVVLAAKIINKL